MNLLLVFSLSFQAHSILLLYDIATLTHTHTSSTNVQFLFWGVCIVFRGVKSQELDTPAIEKRFAYTFLQQLITYVDQAQQHMMDFGRCFVLVQIIIFL